MKGMAYTPFAVLATSMMFLMFISPLDVYPSSVNQDIGAVETAQTMDRSIENSFAKGFGLTVTQHLEDYNENLDSPITDAQSNFSDAYDPNSDSHYSLNQVEGELNNIFQSDDRRQLILETGDGFDFSASGLTIESRVSVEYSLTDDIIGTMNTLNQSTISQASIDGAKDPLAEFNAGENIEYSYCGYHKPAYFAGSGSASSNSVISGEAVYMPEDLASIDNKEEKILFIESEDNFDNSELDQFAAVITEDSSYSNDHYVQGFELERTVNTGETVIIKENGVYVSYFREILDNQCFVESNNAPDIFARMEDDNLGSQSGIMTFVVDTGSSGEANEDYVYFDDSRSVDGSAVNVTGLNSNENDFDERPWFNVDNNNLNEWGISELEE